ncbi:MAG: C39 family peptidase [Candidatus Rokubacteria bacterium]|nr:C39 family peptidase [Candidatus Rokubacteria bacterium]
MTTDLFAAVRGIPAAVITGAVPPACRRPVDTLDGPRADGGDVLLPSPEWRPRAPARHLVPALAALGRDPRPFRFELSARRAGAWSPWVATATVGDAAFAPLPAEADGLRVDVDVITTDRPIDAVRVRVRLRAAAAPADGAWLVTLSASETVTAAGREWASGDRGGATALAVPALSQMDAAPDVRPRVCSPTSVAMVLGYWGVAATIDAVAADLFHPGLDIYGVWPAAIQAAARRGIAGYLLRFPDWTSAAWCLARGLPIVASVRYARGELRGAAIDETPGHLIVLTGSAADTVLVNDPAAPTARDVPRRYALADIRRVWLERAGVGYVLFRPA